MKAEQYPIKTYDDIHVPGKQLRNAAEIELNKKVIEV
jgi:hypothetical protein